MQTDHPGSTVSNDSSIASNSLNPRWSYSVAEIAVVAVVLGLLMVLVAPRMTTAANADREVELKQCLLHLRTQIAIYQAQHHGIAPGYPNGNTAMMPTHEAFLAQMTRYTNSSGLTSDTPSDEFKFGPYLSNMPRNPLNKSLDIRFVDPLERIPTVSEDYGWVYQPVTGSVVINSRGSDIFNVKYTDY